MKAYLGIIGRSFSGKETVYQILKELAAKYRIPHKISIHHFSDPLNDILDILTLEKNRPNQQKLSTILRQGFSEEVLGDIIMARAIADRSEIVCLDGIRRPADVVKFKKLSNNHLLFVNAPAEIRFQRGQQRADRSIITWDQFQKEQSAEAESKINEIAREADTVLENSGTKDELRNEVLIKIMVRILGIRNLKEVRA